MIALGISILDCCLSSAATGLYPLDHRFLDLRHIIPWPYNWACSISPGHPPPNIRTDHHRQSNRHQAAHRFGRSCSRLIVLGPIGLVLGPIIAAVVSVIMRIKQRSKKTAENTTSKNNTSDAAIEIEPEYSQENEDSPAQDLDITGDATDTDD